MVIAILPPQAIRPWNAAPATQKHHSLTAVKKDHLRQSKNEPKMNNLTATSDRRISPPQARYEPSGNQRPDLLTSLMNTSFVLRLPREMHLWRSSSNVPRLPSFLEMPQNLTFCSLLTRCTIPCACHAKAHLNVQMCSVPVSFFALLTSKCASCHNGVHFFDISTSKSGPNPGVFNILTWKCASRHNGVHFFDVSTSKSGPNLVCFVHFDLEMCFAPQHALFHHLNFKKWSEPGVFCTF